MNLLIYVKCPLEICELRDPKGLYVRERKGEINHLTGIDSPYEEPARAELTIDTSRESVEEAVEDIVEYLHSNGYLASNKKLTALSFD